MAIVPWKSQFRAPSSWKQPANRAGDAPFIDVQLEWVHGYQSKTSKKNIAIIADGCVAYHAAAVGIVYEQ